jgi:molecular chaperone DnaK (HSP70)
MGAGSTTATVVEYSYAKPSKSASKVPTLKIKSTAYDRTLGGLEFDLVLRDHLVKVWPALPLH